jgi:hypothetical protein
MWHNRRQDDILPLWEADSLPSDPCWTDSPVGTPFFICAIMSPVPATCPFGCTALHKCLLLRLSSQRRSCAIYLITAVPQRGFSCTNPRFHLLWGNNAPLPSCWSEQYLQITSMVQVLRCSHYCGLGVLSCLEYSVVSLGNWVLTFIRNAENWLPSDVTYHPRRTRFARMRLVESINLLQPENILLASKAPETLIKVVDFGVSKILRPGTQMGTCVGTQYYQAPEILDRAIPTYTKQVDIWSMGILLYLWYVHYALTEFIAFTVTIHN